MRLDLAALVGREHALTDADVRAGYEVDWTGRFRGTAAAVVRPADTAEVVAVLDACREAGVAVVPQGGNTGLVGGGVPRGGEVVLSLRRLDRLDDVDVLAGEVTVGAGATLGAVQRHVAPHGLEVPVDLAARDAATIGGMVATNAGGLHAFRFGAMRRHVVGIEAVLADGSVVRRLPGLVKDNTGYDLPGLLAGSEGTLAVVTAVRLRLLPARPHTVVALAGLRSTTDAQLLLPDLLATAPSLVAAELFHEEGLALVCDHARLPRPLPGTHGAYVLLECAAASHDPTEELTAALSGVEATAVGDDLWAYRERHTEAINARGVPHKLDVAVPLARLADFEDAVRAAVGRSGHELYLFGHLGDGNVHVNVVGPHPDDESVDDTVLRLVATFGGSISAEHGIGVAKRRWLPLVRGEGDLAAMRAIKRALDPTGMLNPGVLVD